MDGNRRARSLHKRLKRLYRKMQKWHGWDPWLKHKDGK